MRIQEMTSLIHSTSIMLQRFPVDEQRTRKYKHWGMTLFSCGTAVPHKMLELGKSRLDHHRHHFENIQLVLSTSKEKCNDFYENQYDLPVFIKTTSQNFIKTRTFVHERVIPIITKYRFDIMYQIKIAFFRDTCYLHINVYSEAV